MVKEIKNRQKNTQTPLIIGFGDEFYGDDGIGIILTKKLQSLISPFDAKIINGGKNSSIIIDYIDTYNKILIIDGVKMGKKIGEWKLFKFAEIKKNLIKNIISYHQFGVLENLLLAESIGKNIDNTFIFGIQIEKIEPGSEISSLLKKKIPLYLSQIKQFIYSPGSY